MSYYANRWERRRPGRAYLETQLLREHPPGAHGSANYRAFRAGGSRNGSQYKYPQRRRVGKGEWIDENNNIIEDPENWEGRCWHVAKNWTLSIQNGVPTFAMPRYGGNINFLQPETILLDDEGNRACEELPLPTAFPKPMGAKPAPRISNSAREQASTENGSSVVQTDGHSESKKASKKGKMKREKYEEVLESDNAQDAKTYQEPPSKKLRTDDGSELIDELANTPPPASPPTTLHKATRRITPEPAAVKVSGAHVITQHEIPPIPWHQEGQTLMKTVMNGFPRTDAECTMITPGGIIIVCDNPRQRSFFIDPTAIHKVIWSRDGNSVRLLTGEAGHSWTHFMFSTCSARNLFFHMFRQYYAGMENIISEQMTEQELSEILASATARMRKREGDALLSSGAPKRQKLSGQLQPDREQTRSSRPKLSDQLPPENEHSKSSRQKLSDYLTQENEQTKSSRQKLSDYLTQQNDHTKSSRQKLSDQLPLANEHTQSSTQKFSDKLPSDHEEPKSSRPESDSDYEPPEPEIGRGIANGTARPRRQRMTETEEAPIRRYSQEVGLGATWTRPLIYPTGGSNKTNGPASGNNKTTVDFDDLLRLDDGQYLNDNLIAFYMKYLQVEKDNGGKKIYFMNTYFYETLKKGTPKGKSINYDAVKRWTSKVDLFEYDYIVVPVNEGYHWYAAIICHPNNLIESKEQSSAKPLIMTLDSLGNAHPGLIRDLKDYLSEEAFARKNIEIGVPSGWTAKGLPEQNNLFDCGLYLLGYVAKFYTAPDSFVKRVVRREMSARDWPEFNPSEMRHFIRDLIFKKHNDMIMSENQKSSQLTPQNASNSTSNRTSPSRTSVGHHDGAIRRPGADGSTGITPIDLDESTSYPVDTQNREVRDGAEMKMLAEGAKHLRRALHQSYGSEGEDDDITFVKEATRPPTRSRR